MPLQAVPIPAGDVIPRGRRAPQKPLPPGPGTQVWPRAPSQLESGRDCISPGAEAGRPRLAPGHGHGRSTPSTGAFRGVGTHSCLGPARARPAATSTPHLRASQRRPQRGQLLISLGRNVGVGVAVYVHSTHASAAESSPPAPSADSRCSGQRLTPWHHVGLGVQAVAEM